ncbi:MULTISPECIES: type II secretion system protein GspG [Delftia]|nr:MULTISPECIES: type II secretion system protein GspG [Delftia]
MGRLKLVLLFFFIVCLILGLFFFEGNPKKQRMQTTSHSLAGVGRAIYLFKEKFNRYPKDLDELAPPEGDFIYPTARILDAWEQPIIYKYTPTESKTFKLYSIGENNKDESGDGDDLNFWRLKIKIQ